MVKYSCISLLAVWVWVLSLIVGVSTPILCAGSGARIEVQCNNGDIADDAVKHGGWGIAQYVTTLINLPSSASYVRQFHHVQRGYGKYSWANGDVYDGDWSAGQMHGYGKFTWSSGSVYVGEFQDDRKHGKGEYIWADGRVYQGEFKDDKIHGNGRYTWPDNSVYDGEFEFGKLHGKGKVQDGKMKNGMGWSNGIVLKGEWKNGRMTKVFIDSSPFLGIEWRRLFIMIAIYSSIFFVQLSMLHHYLSLF